MESRVSDLLKFPFLENSLWMQRKIVTEGRTLMLKNLPKLQEAADSKEGQFSNPVLFEQVQWLVRCDDRRKFFCYNCLLYAPSKAMLNWIMKTNLPTLLKSANKHELTEEHIEASLQLQLFIAENFRTSVQVPEKTQLNLIAKRNREILKRLIDAVCCIVAQKRSYGDGKYTHNRIKVDDCCKFLEFLREFDKSNIDLVDGATDMLKRYPRIVNDMVDAITRVVKTAIKNETHQSTYVSIILSEHGSPQIKKSQISTVLRYIKKGKVCERFIGFSNGLDTSSKLPILKHIFSIIEQYGITERFLALSLDGKVLPKGSLSSLIASIKIDYQYSYFVPWYSHGFGNTLLQTLYEYDDCGLFLKKIQAMENFFQNSKCRESLEVALKSKHPELRRYKFYEASPFIIFVARYRKCFIEFFDSVINNCKYWETDDITNAIAFRALLQKVFSVFFLHLFNKIFLNNFDQTLNFITESGNEMFVFDNPKILAFKKHIANLTFVLIWDNVVAEISKENPNSVLAIEMKTVSVMHFYSLFHNLLRHLYKEVDVRCNYLSRLKFCDLLNCNSNGKYVCSPQLLMVLMTEHGPFFTPKDLESEVVALNSNTIFQEKSVHDLMECFSELNLRIVFPQLYKLAEFILTLPFLPSSRDRMTSKLKDINKCSYIPETTGIPSGESSFLRVETEMLKDVKKSPLFYEDVLARFYEVNKSLLLIQV